MRAQAGRTGKGPDAGYRRMKEKKVKYNRKKKK